MAGPVKVVVLENDYAKLCELGLSLSLSCELQSKELSLRNALWSARASGGGFSISLFWPSGSPEEKKPRRRRRTRSLQASKKDTNNNNSFVPCPSSHCPTGGNERLSPAKRKSSVDDSASAHGVAAAPPPNHERQSERVSLSIKATDQVQNSDDIPYDHSSSEDSSDVNTAIDLISCTNVQYEVVDGVQGVTYERDGESGWTQVVGKRKKRKSCSSGQSLEPSSSDVELGNVIPSDPNVVVTYHTLANSPGLRIRQNRLRLWTPIAARTRCRVIK